MNRPVIKKAILFFLSVLFFFSCNNNADNNTALPAKADTIAASTSKVDSTVTVPTSLHDLLIDTNYFNKKTARAGIVNPAAYAALGLPRILKPEELKEPSAKIKILDTLVFTNNSLLLLLSRETENEHWAWLVQYDNKGMYQSHQLVFYEDFVEYFSTTSTRVKNSTIIITTQTNGDDNKSEKVQKYLFSDGHKLEAIK